MSTSAHHIDRIAVRKGAVAIIAAVFLMSFADSLVKFLSSDVTLWQIYSLRGIVAICLLWLVAWRRQRSLRAQQPSWVAFRSLLLVLMWVAYFASLPVLDFATAAVLLYASPLLITVLSMPIFKERFRLHQWAAVACGFIGVVIIVRPGTDGLNPYAALPLIAALLYSLAMVITRAKCRDEDPQVLSFWMNAGMLLFGVVVMMALWAANPSTETVAQAPFLLTVWRPLTLIPILIIIGLGILISIYVGLTAQAYQIAPPSAIAPFDYLYLVFAAVWSWMLFAAPPDGPTILGGSLIAIAGLISFRGARP